MDILRTFLIAKGYDELVAGGMRLAPAPHAFDKNDGFNPGSLGMLADTIMSAEPDLTCLVCQVTKLLGFGAQATVLEANGLIAFSFENPDHDPQAAIHRMSYSDSRRVQAERYTLFVELVTSGERREPPRGLTVLDALQYAGYARHLYGDHPSDDMDDDLPPDPTGEPYYWRNGF